MFKNLITLALSLGFSFSAFALANRTPESPWVPVYELTEKATSESSFSFLQRKYPDIFGKYDSKTVVSAQVSSYVFEYQDVHTCAPNDSRLKFKATSYGVCQGTIYNSSCFQTSISMPSPHDPCGR